MTDRRGTIEPVDTLAEDLAADITQWMPGSITPEIAEKLQQEINAESNATAGTPDAGPSSSAADAVRTCTCACEKKDAEALVPECQTRCQLAWPTW